LTAGDYGQAAFAGIQLISLILDRPAQDLIARFFKRRFFKVPIPATKCTTCGPMCDTPNGELLDVDIDLQKDSLKDVVTQASCTNCQILKKINVVPLTDIEKASEIIKKEMGVILVPEKPALVPYSKIRWTQNTCDRFSDGRDILETAKDLASGKTNPKNIPPILLFVDDEGRIWSHDNRRLVSAVLGGKGVINAQLMSAKRAQKDALRHLSTNSEGNCIDVVESGKTIKTVWN
jgi:hypothetical protein